MSQWLRKGLTAGIKTTRYPAREESAVGISPGLPRGGPCPEAQARELIDCCPTRVFNEQAHGLAVNPRNCVHCFRCRYGVALPSVWREDYEWASMASSGREPRQRFGSAFARSIHILVVDAGDCGACLNEVRQLNNPYYNMHRLGFFVTPTPREADVLLVVGPVTDHMRTPLEKSFAAMPEPKRVMAVGACALSGSVFGPNFVCAAGVREVLPVDIEVPGQPPPPLAILHGLLVAAGRKRPDALFPPARLAAVAATGEP
jgi:Ni,Fe-hydrogenase III small subunit/ferredoxin-like protein FixX